MSPFRRTIAVLIPVVAAAGVIVGPAAPAMALSAVLSHSHYIRNLTSDNTTNFSKMETLGHADAVNGSTTIVLDIGAQSMTPPELSATNPGVALSSTSPTVRLTYSALVFAIKGYLTGFHAGAPTRAATVIVATNSDGAFSGTNAYAATSRGADWSTKVLAPLKASMQKNRYSIAIRGGIDAEVGFSGTLTQVSQWRDSFLAHDADVLFWLGSADGCPTTFGVTNSFCTKWSQSQYYGLVFGGRSRVLPQIYVSGQAQQWTNIDLTGYKGSKGGIIFSGTLSEHAACPTTGLAGCPSAGSFTAANAWAHLRAWLAKIGKAPGSVATDLDIQGT